MVESGQLVKCPNSYLGLTAGGAARQMTVALNAAGIENAATDARLLVPAALGLGRHDLILQPQRLVSPDEARQLIEFERRRAASEPVSRILGWREFYGRRFEITVATLDPRPDSETLIEAALELVRERHAGAEPPRILDIGTGSGCLLLTLLAELPGATGLGTDISTAALEVAARNAAQLGLAERASWQEARSLQGISGSFDVVISNPPYIPTSDLAGLAPDVRLYDPLTALDGGAGGLCVYREIVAGLANLETFGCVLFEAGAGQSVELGGILRDGLGARAQSIRTWSDLGGHTRCVAVLTHL